MLYRIIDLFIYELNECHSLFLVTFENSPVRYISNLVRNTTLGKNN